MKRHSIKIARYKDDTWRAMIFLGFYTGPRASEFTTLKLGMFQPKRGGIVAWPQVKKGMEPRDVLFRAEDWLWDEATDGSLAWYLGHVRPRVAGPNSDHDELFLNSEGKPWTVNGVRNFIREGIEIALGRDGRGPHSLRRACATWRYHCGWDLDEVALLLGDTPDVIKGSYIDCAGSAASAAATTRPGPGLRPRSASSRPRPEVKVFTHRGG